MNRLTLLILLVALLTACGPQADASDTELTTETTDTLTIPGRWTAERANAYYADYPYPVGANYNPRTAINQLDWWQAEYFDTVVIAEELGWAADLGYTSMRVYLHDIAYEKDSAGLLNRMEQYLDLADRRGISTMFVLFDAVWNPEARAGVQPDPVPRRHNSGWVQSPTVERLRDRSQWPLLRTYVQTVLRHFDGDRRVFAWDLYNEPDNTMPHRFPAEPADKKDLTYPLLVEVHRWARAVNPSQPLTTGVWAGRENEPYRKDRFHDFQLANADIVTFHHYGPEPLLDERLDYLRAYGRPLVCTEYVARGNGSTFQSDLTRFVAAGVGAYQWGLVAGKTNTIYPWNSWDSTYVAEPDLWHHDLLRPDGSAYRAEEVDLLGKLLR